jgi:hypothetical protein
MGFSRPMVTGVARRVCYGVQIIMHRKTRLAPVISVQGRVMRQVVLALLLVPFFIAGCASFKPSPTSPEPSSTEIVAQSKGATAESSSTSRAQQSPGAAPRPPDAKQPSPASAVSGTSGTGTQGDAKKDGPAALNAKRPGTDRSEDVPGGAGSAGQVSRQDVARIPGKPAERPPEKPQAPPTLDLASLEQRLRDTRAIGVFTKLSLKNQVDDLLGQFRAYHKKESQISLTELRQRYNLLLLKVLTLLQDNDAPLAATIASSREPIWLILADPGKFAKIDVQ